MPKRSRAENPTVERRSAAVPGHERLRLIARLLPILTLAVWAVTLWVPVLDSANNSLHLSESTRIVITSLGRSPFEAEELELDFVTIWACLLTCVISAWLVDGMRLWSWVTASFGVVLLGFLGDMISEPPTIMWDGQDGNGEWIGGMEVATPDVGAGLWLAGALALFAAGACGLLGERRRCHGRSASNVWPNCREGLRIDRWYSTEPSRDGHIRVRRHRSTSEQAARLLPLVAVAAWVVTIWVPIMDNSTVDDDSVVFTSLGRHTGSLVELNPGVVLAWVMILMCAFVGLAIDPPAWWSVVVVIFGVALSIMLVGLLTYPPKFRWVEETSAGQPFSVTISGFPAAGVNYWALGSAALILAGISGLISKRRRRTTS